MAALAEIPCSGPSTHVTANRHLLADSRGSAALVLPASRGGRHMHDVHTYTPAKRIH